MWDMSFSSAMYNGRSVIFFFFFKHHQNARQLIMANVAHNMRDYSVLIS